MNDGIDRRGHDGVMDVDALLPALRLRARRWSALLDDGPVARIRRAPIRAALLEAAWARIVSADGPQRPRLRITWALRSVWLDARRELARAKTPFAQQHACRLERLVEVEAGLTGDALLWAWDTVLTAAELRPSSIRPPELASVLARAAENRADPALRRRIQAAIADAAQGPAGGFLQRQGVRRPTEIVAAFWRFAEEALLFVLPPDLAIARARTGVENLRRWDAILAELHARVASRRDDDLAQAVVARFLEPRIVAAYGTLPAEELVRIALTAGRNLQVTTLTGALPQAHAPVDGPPAEARVPDRAPDAEATLIARERWVQLFAGLTRGLASGAFDAQRVLFLWLAPALGAGEAWRVVGAPIEGVGSANYHQKKSMTALHALVGRDAPWRRPPNPGRPDEASRGVVAVLAMRSADPCMEAAAEVPADARAQVPPLDDDELVTLLYLFNLGAEGAREALPDGWAVGAAGALVARSIRLQRWDRARVAAARTALAGARAADPANADGLDPRTIAFLLTTMVLGLAGEATRLLDGLPAPTDGEDWEALVRRWLDADGPGHEVIEDLRALPWPVPAPSEAPPRRPVEREARLRRHLRSLVGDR